MGCRNGTQEILPPARVTRSGRGHRPGHSAALPLGQPGAPAPGQRPTRPWRALPARRVGRWP
ncbi:MAG: hypothetical protein ACK446_00015, partial [Rhodobacterales bacterium]